MDSDRRIADVDEVPGDGSLIFRVRDGRDDLKEAILVRLGDGTVTGWLNECQHFTHIPLDKGSGVPRRDGELVCANHGALFEADTGECTYGPCEGAMLRDVGVAVVDGGVYLADGDFDFVGVGPAESDPVDLTSTSNVKF
ncbi:MAG: Rieske (2Fe-2S) protein [Halobacteriaceae archaeon]